MSQPWVVVTLRKLPDVCTRQNGHLAALTIVNAPSALSAAQTAMTVTKAATGHDARSSANLISAA